MSDDPDLPDDVPWYQTEVGRRQRDQRRQLDELEQLMAEDDDPVRSALIRARAIARARRGRDGQD
ncbi:hypothetical protein [Actinomadura hibisca]|uniref:hypothetical protein n=1 Tax=Actinomadura hibisca TaxID=68565 RepID=UPI00082D491D|nr:hypothetical protein [Actinomadura hibisca]